MFKKICNAVLKNIWLQLLALILALCGLTLLIGASFENVSTTSKGFSPSSPDPDASSSEESHESSKDDFDDFLNGSGAFGDWENFSSFYVETEPVPSKPSSTPSSSGIFRPGGLLRAFLRILCGASYSRRKLCPGGIF